jgi:hypothetical protein
MDDSALLTSTYGKVRASNCNNCGNEHSCRRRVFSEQAWTMLLLWNEINPQAVDQPICDECYQEIREILIDRHEEVEAALQDNFPAAHPLMATRKSSILAG